MSAQAFGGQLPAVVTLDDLAAMIAADQYGHRYELSPEGALSVMPPPDSEVVDRDATQTVTMYVLGPDRTYELVAKMPLAWLLQTAPADHHLGA